jgi:predicted RNA-binding protein Jag
LRRPPDGSESQSDRHAPRHQPHLGLRWFADNEYAKLLHEDFRIRKYLREELKQAGISKVVIERPHKKCRVTIHTARPGVVIGKKGADIEKLRRAVAKMTDSKCTSTSLKCASRKSTRPGCRQRSPSSWSAVSLSAAP